MYCNISSIIPTPAKGRVTSPLIKLPREEVRPNCVSIYFGVNAKRPDIMSACKENVRVTQRNGSRASKSATCFGSSLT